MKILIYFITLSAEALTTLALIFSLAFPKHRIWPPGWHPVWGGSAMSVLFVISAGGVFSLGILDWGSFCLPTWLRVFPGGPLWLAGNALALWAIATLGIASTLGGKTTFIHQGPYRFSRNPQYLGFILALAGWALLTDSVMVLIVSLIGFIPLVMVPFTEEPWLLERVGTAYIEYRRTVPRFAGVRKFKVIKDEEK
jgi:protein-S-isoprenylcysteine O-methyltransferase Ste14